MSTVIAIVGRPNVGKSTLFNCLTKTQEAVVLNMPGVTRDRRYGQGKTGGKPYIVVDTCGLYGDTLEDASDIGFHSLEQTQMAMEEAEYLLFLVDAKTGLTPLDQEIAQDLRKLGKPVFLVINKTDGLDVETVKSEFYQLGFPTEPITISASHRRGIQVLMETVLEEVPTEEETESSEEKDTIRIAIVGRPNVGKSTFVNRVLGENRMIVSDIAGTTRDAIEIPFRKHQQSYLLIDTAGMRRQARIQDALEKISVIKTLQAIEKSDVVILMLDAKTGISSQDLHILGWIVEAGRALVIAVNKWDGMSSEDRTAFRGELDRLLFVSFAPVYFISAQEGRGIGDLFEGTQKAYRSAMAEHSPSTLTRILGQATVQHIPPIHNRHRIKLRYAHMGGKNPPVIVIHGSQAENLPLSYQRYLMNFFTKKLRLTGTPIRLVLKSSENPFAGKKNPLTERQIKKKQRLSKHLKK